MGVQTGLGDTLTDPIKTTAEAAEAAALPERYAVRMGLTAASYARIK